MPKIKLSNAATNLNVAQSTIIEFLQKKGITIANNPNTRIEEDAYALLEKEFSNDKEQKAKADSLLSERQKEKKAAKAKPEEIKLTVETQQPKILGKIDLSSAGKPAPKKEEPKEVVKPVVEAKPEAKPEVKPEPKPEPVVVKPEPIVEEKKDEEIFTPQRPAAGPSLNIIGKIDLSAINQQTRPKRKQKKKSATSVLLKVVRNNSQVPLSQATAKSANASA